MIKKVFAALSIMAVIFTGMSAAADLNGAGATFPYPIYSKWMSEYNKIKGIQVNYASIGSGGGIRQFTAGVVDFGATDAYMTNDEISKVSGGVVHVPTVMGAVAVVFNNGLKTLNLDGKTLAAIFMGDIKKWNDERIAELNPGISLPDSSILIAHRSDASGTTSIFTGYLAKVSTDWAAKVGAGKAVAWPVGVGAKGNEGVTGAVVNNSNSIGYVELAYAKQNNLPMAAIKNRSGNYVLPSVSGVTAAADKGMSKIPADFRGEILNMPGSASYPISGLTWIVVRKENSNAEKTKLLKDFLGWSLTKGQDYAGDLYYAPLPQSLRNKVVAALETIK
ncbi:MAG: phosphate ABC transporter substrate-binding protein PstS [Candidatus Saganbacteria bacterium]|nr:phosphate ABC transporter substrate-binding protein PstS [Candidatus Saganbacteria bacterium]